MQPALPSQYRRNALPLACRSATVTKDVAAGATVIDTSPMSNRVLAPKKPKAAPAAA